MPTTRDESFSFVNSKERTSTLSILQAWYRIRAVLYAGKEAIRHVDVTQMHCSQNTCTVHCTWNKTAGCKRCNADSAHSATQ